MKKKTDKIDERFRIALDQLANEKFAGNYFNLAADLGVHQMQLYHIRGGKRSPTVSLMESFALKFRLNMNYIFLNQQPIFNEKD